jgi:N-dimethylarginine dimethylaminohydrolase
MHFLMCPPDFYEVSYKINPWMEHGTYPKAQDQWYDLYDLLVRNGVRISLVNPRPRFPDMVFTANAGTVLDGVVLPALFHHVERAGETEFFTKRFAEMLLHDHYPVETIRRPHHTLEGAGDCIYDSHNELFWVGYGFRSDPEANMEVEEIFGVDSVCLELIDPRFYHLDTALCVLPRGEVMYYPAAFAEASQRYIEYYARKGVLKLSEDDAKLFAANAICLDNDVIVMHDCSDKLFCELSVRGYRVEWTPLDSFLVAGGSASCLHLRLDKKSY